MAAHGKSQPSLTRACTLATSNDQAEVVEYRGQRREPGLVIVLRTKISEHGVRHVTFEQFRTPALPVAEKPFQRFEAMNTRVTPQKFGGGRRRTCARVEQHDGNLSARKRLIDDGQVTEYQRQKTEAQAAFEYCEHPLHGSVRSNVAKAQGEKRCAA